jgi:hypothetical protein
VPHFNVDHAAIGLAFSTLHNKAAFYALPPLAEPDVSLTEYDAYIL